MRRIISTILALGATLFFSTNHYAADIITEYSRIINWNNVWSYSVYDLNGDGIKELFVNTFGSEAERELYIYAFLNGNIRLMYKTQNGHSNNYIGSDGKVYRFSAHMGYAFIDRVDYIDGKIKETTILKEERVEDYNSILSKYQLRELESRNANDKSLLNDLVYVSSGWKQTNGKWWYQNADGTYLVNQWSLIDGNWYYFDGRGYMMKDTWIGGRYYLGKNGAMLVNTITPDGYRVGIDGAWMNENTNEPVPPSKEVTDALSILEQGVVYKEQYYENCIAYLTAFSTEGAKVVDRGSYYEVSNAQISIQEESSDPSIIVDIAKNTTVYIRKNAVIMTEYERAISAEQMYNIYGRFSIMNGILISPNFKIDSEGYIVGINGYIFG